MRFVRIDLDGTPTWGMVEGEEIVLGTGAPYLDWSLGDRRVPLAAARLLAPAEPSKIYCLGRNYEDHVLEMGYQPATAPAVFMKGPNTIIGPGEDVILPAPEVDSRIEHEAELAIVIGRPARMVAAADAYDYIFGYTCSNDVSARTIQRSEPYPTRGKGFDTFCPLGPWIETDFDPGAGARVRCLVNGEVRQDGLTTQMIHTVPALIEYLSGFATLLPGDLVLTGSPGGSATLAAGDQVDIEIEGLGTLRHGVA